MGVPMVVLNITGGAQTRGAAAIYHAAPDGYTIGFGGQSESIAQILEEQDYDMRKFSQIGRVQSTQETFFVMPDSPFKSFKDFKTFGKPIRFPVFSLTTGSTVVGMILSLREKFPLKVIGGYKQQTEATLALLRGDGELIVNNPSVGMVFFKTGEIRPILTIGPKRYPSFPEIPSVAEMGYKDLANLSLDIWLMGPPEIPKERLKILEDALMSTLKDPEFVNWAKKVSIDLGPLNGEDNAKRVLDFFKVVEPYKRDIEKNIMGMK